jgi:hypothetical protein
MAGLWLMTQSSLWLPSGTIIDYVEAQATSTGVLYTFLDGGQVKLDYFGDLVWASSTQLYDMFAFDDDNHGGMED